MTHKFLEIVSDVISSSHHFISIAHYPFTNFLPRACQLFQPHAFTVASTPGRFSSFSSFFAPSPFYRFTASLSLSLSLSLRCIVVFSPRRNDEKSTEPLIGSVNPVGATCTLMGRVGWKEEGGERVGWKNVETMKHGSRRPERFVTGIQRSTRATFITVARFFCFGSVPFRSIRSFFCFSSSALLPIPVALPGFIIGFPVFFNKRGPPCACYAFRRFDAAATPTANNAKPAIHPPVSIRWNAQSENDQTDD